MQFLNFVDLIIPFVTHLFFMFTIIEFNRSCGEMSTYIFLSNCLNYVIIVIGIAHYVVI